MRVLVITNNLQQASFRLRIEALRDALAQRGVELDIQVRPRAMLPRRHLLRRANLYDAVILQRKMLDPLDTRLLAKNARKLFFDVDDAVMFHSRPVGPIERWRTARRFSSIAKSAQIVAGNEYLAELFRQRGATVDVLPTVVDPGHYQVKTHAPTDRPTLVWIGSKSTISYVAQFAPVLANAGQRVPGLRLITIADVPLVNCPIPAEHVPWSVAGESAALVRGDVGIAPMPDDPWTRGKCGFKIIQYMASGLPVIASSVGANREIVVDGQTGMLANSPADWTAAIAALACDLARRQEMGSAGRKRVEEKFSVERAAEFWAAALKSSTG
jgi:glycosyltransferase involved in cell wall biosynthesis